MTYSDVLISSMEPEPLAKKLQNELNSKHLVGVLRRARAEGRAACGVGACASALHDGAPGVLCVVLAPPSTSDDPVTSRILSTLVQAFCLEHDVPIVKVDSSERLSSHVGQRSTCVVIRRRPDDVELPFTSYPLIQLPP